MQSLQSGETMQTEDKENESRTEGRRRSSSFTLILGISCVFKFFISLLQ